MPFLFAHAAKMGHRLYFLGSSEEVLEIATRKCLEQYPGLNICGTFAPPYAKLLELDEEEIARRIREARPDILLVAMGCPKQEKWIYKNYRKLGVPVSIGIGASLDFIAGKFRRAPVWMRVCGLEWVFRLMQEPRRLFNRYLFDLLFFVRTLRKERALLMAKAGKAAVPAEGKVIENESWQNVVCYVWSGRIDADAVLNKAVAAINPDRNRPNVLLDCSKVTFIDSMGLGLFIKSFRNCKAGGGTFVVLKPSEIVGKMLVLMQLDRLIPTAKNDEEAGLLLKITAPATTEFTEFSIATRTVTVPLSGDLTAATVAACERFVFSAWNNSQQALFLSVDLTRVSFIDSSGLGLLIKFAKLVRQRPGAELTILNPSANVRNVIHLAHLGGVLGLKPSSS